MEKLVQITHRIIRIGFGCLFILVPLVLTPWNYELFEYNKMMVTYGFTAIIIGAWIIQMIATNEFRVKRTPLDIPIALFVLSQLISTLFSMDPHVSWFGYYSRFNGGMISVFTYVALYYAFVSNFISQSEHAIENGKRMTENRKNIQNPPSSTLRFPPSIFRLLQVILITGLVVSIYGILEHFGIDKNLWVQDVQRRVFSTLGQPNWLAAYLIALAPLSMALALWKMENGKWKIGMENRNSKIEKNENLFSIFNFLTLSFIFYFLLAILYFIALLWTRSRSGLFAFAVADIIFWGILFIRCHLAQQGDTCKKQFFPLFFLLHIVFFLIIVINGVYIQQIDDWVTIKAWQQRITEGRRHLPAGEAGKTEDSKETQSTQSSVFSPPSSSPLIQSGVTDSGDIRKYVWQGALNIWKSSPKAFLIGTGTETYAFAFYQYKPVGHNLTSEWDFLYNKAHNEYLNFLATTGIFGLGTYVCIIAAFIYWFIKFSIFNFQFSIKNLNFKFQIEKLQNKNHLDPKRWFISVGLFSGWLSILITNFFGFSVVIMQIFFYLFPAFIIILSSPQTSFCIYRVSWKEKTKKILTIMTGCISLFFVVGIIIAWVADKRFATGYHLSRSGYFPQAYQALSSAILLNPTEPLYHDEQGNVLATLAVASWKDNQATVSQELATMAVKENDYALHVSPQNVNFWKTRTKIFYALSAINPEYLRNAIEALEKGITLSPRDPKMYYNLAILYGQTDTMDKSIEFMKKSIELKPNYREGYYGLYLLLKENGRIDEAIQTIREYLEKVDPKDEEFLTIIQ